MRIEQPSDPRELLEMGIVDILFFMGGTISKKERGKFINFTNR